MSREAAPELRLTQMIDDDLKVLAENLCRGFAACQIDRLQTPINRLTHRAGRHYNSLEFKIVSRIQSTDDSTTIDW